MGCDNSVDQLIPDPTATPEGWALVWADEFDGAALDTTKWETQTGDGCPDLCGWGNNELQSYQRENVSVGDGVLTITARARTSSRETPPTLGARSARRAWATGPTAASRSAPSCRPQQGLWPAIWMLSTDEVYGDWAASGEIDIMEAIGSEPGEIFGTLHYGDTFPINVFSSEPFEFVTGTYADDFFVYTVEWEEGEIRWYINNVLYATQDRVDHRRAPGGGGRRSLPGSVRSGLPPAAQRSRRRQPAWAAG